MDSFLYVGYRVDCKIRDKRGWDLMNKIPGCEMPPSNKWAYWPNDTDAKCDSYLWMEGPNSYWCPQGQHSMWYELESATIDLPENHAENMEKIRTSDAYRAMQDLYGEVAVRWGVFKGMG